jgi:hypothetical protein
MRSKKEARSLLPGVRRLPALLADIHPLVVAQALYREHSDEAGIYPQRN